MKVRSITLDNVRRFTDPVTVGPIGDGVTLLCEPNEAGKSTLFDALHALFFINHSSKAAHIKTLRPHSGGKIAVECTLEHAGAQWRVRKEWLTGESAKVWRDGALVHQAEAAEDWISGLVAGDAGGPGGLLWVRQGRVAIGLKGDKDDSAELEKRRDLLTAISGAMEQVTGGERMDRTRDRVAADLAKLQTATRRPKAGGRWAEAQDAVDTLSAQQDELATKVAGLRNDLDERQRQRRNLAELENPDAREARRINLAEAVADLQEAEGLAKELEAAQTQAKLARLESDSAQAEGARIAHLWSEFQAAREHHAAALEARNVSAEKAEAARQTDEDAKARLVAATTAHARSTDILRQIDARTAAAKAKAERAQLRAQITQATNADEACHKSRARVAKGPDAATVATLDRLANALAAKQAVRDAAAPQVSVSYQAGAGPVTLSGAPLAEGELRALPEDGRIDMPGLGRLHIETTDKNASAEYARAEGALVAALAAGQWADLAALHAAARTRAAAERDADLAEKTRDTLAPDGLEALRIRLAHLGDDAVQDDSDLPSAEAANRQLELAAAAFGSAQADAMKTADKYRAAALVAAQAETSETGAQARKVKAGQDVADLPKPDPDAQHSRLLGLEAAAKAAEDVLAQRAAQTPDLNQLRARHSRMKAVATRASDDAASLKSEISKLDGRIETRGEEGVEEVLQSLGDRLKAAHETLARVVFEKDVLVRLLAALDAAQKEARETYFAPVMQELQPLLADLWEECELKWSDDTLLPVALVRKGTEEKIDVLSGGTQEQIAFLVRLAFARLLAKSGRHAPLILDDALVYSDDDRIERMFDALHSAAQDLQIIVLSCRQRAFRDLGAPNLSFQPITL